VSMHGHTLAQCKRDYWRRPTPSSEQAPPTPAASSPGRLPRLGDSAKVFSCSGALGCAAATAGRSRFGVLGMLRSQMGTWAFSLSPEPRPLVALEPPRPAAGAPRKLAVRPLLTRAAARVPLARSSVPPPPPTASLSLLPRAAPCVLAAPPPQRAPPGRLLVLLPPQPTRQPLVPVLGAFFFPAGIDPRAPLYVRKGRVAPPHGADWKGKCPGSMHPLQTASLHA
jgi:hypothetical protein